MRAVRLAYLLLAVVAGAAALPGQARALDPPTASCNGGGCGGWFRSGVTVSWSFNGSGATGTSGCGAATVGEDTTGATFTCTVNYGGSFVGSSVTVQMDSTPPSVNGVVSRDPDNNGWYTHPVDVGFGADGGTSGLAGCSGAGTYGGPDSGGAVLSGTCTDNAGNSGSTSLTIRYDATPPTVAAKPSRPADANGWYNHPVDIEFTGSDAGSGIAECSPKVAYQGPDAAPAKLVGQCRDAAGHLSAPITVELRYDSTPPARPNVKWVNNGESISLAWTADKNVVQAKVVRAPGRKGKKPGVVYQGRARKFVDKKLRSGTRYRYEITLYDQAGNVSTKIVGLKPAMGIYAPAQGAVVKKPPVVAWSPVAEARFYNLQLWRGKVKLLTTWVRAPKLELPYRWKLKGASHSLVNGRYTLYVWPAFGTQRDPKYGKLLGQVGFTFRRR